MVRSIDSAALSEPEILVRQLRGKLPAVFTERSVEAFCDAFLLVLQIGIKLGFTPMILYLPSRPKVSESLVVQFQLINTTIARRESEKDWFHELFSLFQGMASLLSLSWDEIENRIAALS